MSRADRNILPDSFQFNELVTDDIDTALVLAHTAHDKTQLSDDITTVSRHYNKPQLRSMLVGANEEYAVWGRGTGKSEGLIAPRSFRNVEVMPRGHGCFVGATYLQLLERTLPPVIKGWEQMGMVRGRDFWIRERPPKRFNVPAPIVGPVTSDHCIFFKNGAVASMVSQDRPGSANGKTVHWIIGDEAKFLDKTKLDNELLMTNRGDERYFGGIPEFHSLLFCTDMPTTKSAMWILDQEKRADPARVQLLLSIRHSIYELYSQLLAFPYKRSAILKAITEKKAYWDKLRANCVFFSEASTLDNVHGFGIKNIAKLRRQLPNFIFQTAILNKRPFLTENSFYPDLDEHHFYDAYNYAYIDQFEVGAGQFDDSRKDGDVDPYSPLDIGGDYGASINPIMIGQAKGRQYRVLKELYVLHPERLRHVAQAFCKYYKHHACKVARYFYDHTAIATSATNEVNYADTFAEELRKEGWEVDMVYIGHVASPIHRYEMWGRCLTGGDAKLFDVRFNRSNCQYSRISMQQTQIKQGGQGFAKNKGDEKKLNLDQRETTHFSDACDTLLVGAHLYHQFGSQEAFDAIFSS